MKTICTLTAILMVILLSAQTVSKSGHGTMTKSTSSSSIGAKNSSSSSVKHSSTYSTGKSSPANYPTSSTPKSTQSTYHYSKNLVNDTYTSSDKNEVNYIHVEAKETEQKGGIYKVGNDPLTPENYEDKDKNEATTGDENTGENETATTVDSTQSVGGLSSEIKSQNPYPKKYLTISCETYQSLSRGEKFLILRQFNQFDLEQLHQCNDVYSVNEKYKVTCTEFKNATNEAKNYLLNNPDFYDLSDLKNCAAYTDFINK